MKKVVLAITCILLFSIVHGQNWNETQKVVPSDRTSNFRYGSDVDIDGAFAVVGNEDNKLDTSGLVSKQSAGAAYFLKRQSDGTWTELHKVVAFDRDANAFFGRKVAIYGDHAVICAPGETKSAQGGTGNILSGAGAVYMFKRNSNDHWDFVEKLVAPQRHIGSGFGSSADIDGNMLNVGARGQDSTGCVFVYKFDGSNWINEDKVQSSDIAKDNQFGYELKTNGSFMAVSAVNTGVNGSVYIFEKDGIGKWVEKKKVLPSDPHANVFTYGFHLSINEAFLLVSAEDDFQDSLGQGGISAPNIGSIYVYRNTGSDWVQSQKLKPSVTNSSGFSFGNSLEHGGEYLLAGAFLADTAVSNPQVNEHGSAYVFKLNTAGHWVEEKFIYSSDLWKKDLFGYAVAYDGHFAIISSPQTAYDETGGNFLPQAGGVYVFEGPAPIAPPIGIKELESQVYVITPNPASSFIMIQGIDSKENYEIYSLLGNRVDAGMIDQDKKLEVNQLENGIYIFRLINQQQTVKFVINR